MAEVRASEVAPVGCGMGGRYQEPSAWAQDAAEFTQQLHAVSDVLVHKGADCPVEGCVSGETEWLFEIMKE